MLYPKIEGMSNGRLRFYKKGKMRGSVRKLMLHSIKIDLSTTLGVSQQFSF